MSLSRFILPYADVGSGIKPSDGAQLFFFETGTGIPANTYNCPDGTTANSNPVIADSKGVFPDIWIEGTFKVVLQDKNGSQIDEWDPVSSSADTVFVTQNTILHDTLAGAKSRTDLVDNPTNPAIIEISDRGFGKFEVTSGDTADGFRVISAANGLQLRNTNEEVVVEEWVDDSMTTTVRTQGIQAAIEYAMSNLVSLTASPSSTFSIDNTFLIPNQPVYGESVDLCWNDCAFDLASDMQLFTSAYYNVGVLTSNVGTPLMAHPTYGVKLHRFRITNSVGIYNTPALEIQDWFQGTYIGEILDKVSRTVLRSVNNFYCKFGEISTLTPTSTSGGRFIFEGSHNLNDIRHLQAGNGGFGYFFDGPVTATSLRHMSFEGMAVGARFQSTVYNCNVVDSYNENITDTHFSFSDPIESFHLSSNYLNFTGNPGSYLLDYTAGPENNFMIEDDNTFVGFSDNQFFKTVDTTIGYNMGRITRKKKFSFSIDDFLVDNTNIPKSTNVIQPLEQLGLKTHQVNNFAEGIYAGRFTDGYARSNGFEWVDTASTAMEIRTKLVSSDTQKIYVNIRVSASGLFIIKGEFIGNDFYEYTPTTQQLTTNLSISIVGGFIHINGTQAATVTNVNGEVRLT